MGESVPDLLNEELRHWKGIFEANSGTPAFAEPVDPGDLRRHWDLTQAVNTKYPAAETGPIGLDIRLVESFHRGVPGGADISGAHIIAVWLRAGLLHVLQAEGALVEWEHGMGLDDVVFQVAATFPFNGRAVDPQLFRELLRAASDAK